MNRSQNENKNSETLHISKSIDKGYAALNERYKLWELALRIASVVFLLLLLAGAALFASGQLPEKINLVSISPFESSHTVTADKLLLIIPNIIPYIAVITLLAGVALFFVTRSAYSLVMAVTISTLMYAMPLVQSAIMKAGMSAGENLEKNMSFSSPGITPKLDSAIEDKSWQDALDLIKPLESTSADHLMLMSQLSFKAGDKDQSVSLIKSHALGKDFPSEAWMIETLYAKDTGGKDYQMTEPSKLYEKTQAKLRSESTDMFMLAGLFALISLIFLFVKAMLEANLRIINSYSTSGR